MRVELAEPNRFTRMLSYRYDRQDIPTITGITIDTRKVQPGDLFVPIAGSRVDGHDLAAQAVEAGAVALLVERKIPPLPTDPPVVMVADTIEELGSIAKSWRGTYTQPLVAITGSNGKTTTKNLAVEVLSSKYDVLGTEGSYNSTIGLPLTLMRLGEQHHMAVVELGSNQPGEIAYLAGIAQPVVALITNVRETHLEHLKNMAGVAREKCALFEALPASGTAVVNIDDPAIARMETPGHRLTYGFGLDENGNPADVKGRYIETENGGELVVGDDQRIRLPQIGEHLAYNALAAVAVASLFDIPQEAIQQAVENFQLPPGRGQITTHNGVTVIDDTYNANLSSTLAGLRTLLSLLSKGRRIAVLGDMLELGPLSAEHHRNVGEFAATQGVDELFCYGTESLTICNSARSKGMTARHFENKSELSRALARTLTAGDVLYIKGSRGMAMETILTEVFKGH